MIGPRFYSHEIANNGLRTNHIRSKLKLKSFCSRFRECFNQYVINTTLHGLKYIGDRTISRFERCFFTLMFIMVLGLSAYFIGNVWNRWKMSPIIVVLDSHGTSIRDIPFPAVTLCNMNQALKSEVAKISRNSEEYSVLQSICRYPVDTNVTSSGDGKWETFRKVLLNVSQPCKQMLVACRYGGREFNCTSIFSPILTDGGICCIFNGVHRKFMMKLKYNRSENFRNDEYMEKMANNWTPETGFHSDELKKHRDGYPRPALGSGNHVGLSIILNTTVDEYYCSSTNGFGFKVMLHSPNELPVIDYYGLGIANGYESSIIATPVLSTASSAIRKMSVKIRECLFENENFLSLYRLYSRVNCRSECETEIFQEQCDCVLYYMPRRHSNITICGQSDSDCVDKVTRELQSRENEKFHCNCLYGCYDLKYDSELSSTPIFNRAPLLDQFGVSAEDVAVLHIYYENLIYSSQKKEQLVGFTEFLSNIGGLLGLFMGFSAFSIIELFYFFTIRPCCNHLKSADKRNIIFKPFRLRRTRNSDNSTNMNSVVVHHID